MEQDKWLNGMQAGGHEILSCCRNEQAGNMVEQAVTKQELADTEEEERMTSAAELK